MYFMSFFSGIEESDKVTGFKIGLAIDAPKNAEEFFTKFLFTKTLVVAGLTNLGQYSSYSLVF